MEVANWQFQSLRNKLVIHVKIDSQTENSGGDCTATQVNNGSTLQWLKLFFNGVTLYLKDFSKYLPIIIIIIHN